MKETLVLGVALPLTLLLIIQIVIGVVGFSIVRLIRLIRNAVKH